MRRNQLVVNRMTPASLKNAILHLFPHYMTFLPRKKNSFIATGFFLALTAYEFESQRAMHTKTITPDINHSPFAASVEQRKKSVLNFTPEEIQYYTENRLRPKSNEPQAYWGCSSQTGFLAPEDDLLKVAQRDKKTLEKLGITFEQVADAMEGLIRTARTEPEKSVNGLRVTVSQPTVCSQYCPFSPPGADDECGPFDGPKDACGRGNREITITNIRTGEQLSFSALLPHLIRDHHFFEGSVPYRLAPEKIIQFLGLTPVNIGEFINQTTVVTPPALFGNRAAAEIPSMQLSGGSRVCGIKSVMKQHALKFYDSDGDIEAWLLPYNRTESELDSTNTDFQRCNNLYLHFLNVGKKAVAVDDIFQGMRVKLIIPPEKRIILGPIPRASFQPDDEKKITILDPVQTPQIK